MIRVQADAFDPGALLSDFGTGSGEGAVVSFTGVVRDGGGLVAMEIEHYPAMTENALRGIADQAVERFGLTRVGVVHRYGRLVPGEVIMMVLAAAPHRAAAFDGACFMMDYLKSRAPFWKKEQFADRAVWVAARAEDDAARERWGT